MPSLSDFILSHMEGILQEWENFAAAQLPAATSMSSLQLRDHAEHILKAVVKDMRSAQSLQQQSDKSKGRQPRAFDAPETAAETHALLRAKSGFDIKQMVAEYRALRASVLARWAARCTPAPDDFEDMVRFNEAIDQALAESVAFFHMQVSKSRNLFLGVLGHDLRNPLDVIQMSAAHLTRVPHGDTVVALADRIARNGTRMKALIDDLVDFNRAQFGLGLPVRPEPVRLGPLLEEEIAQLRLLHGANRLELELQGEIHGQWDKRRLQQMLGNLLINAIKYGTPSVPVRVIATSDGDEVSIAVRNEGPCIDPAEIEGLFEPLRRGSQERHATDASMGLGLFIAKDIARSHGGSIEARSDVRETVFTVRLPLRCEAAGG